MAKYKLNQSGVKDTETGGSIPNDMGNRHWAEYINWLDGLDAEGNDMGTGPNTPDPEFTPAEIADNELRSEINDLKAQLSSAMVWQFRMILALFQVGKDKGVWVNDDFDQEIQTKAGNWKQHVDRLAEIDE